MSSYATTAQLAQLAINAAALTSISSGDQQTALDSASTEIDGYLSSQYILPLSSWGTDLVEHVCHIAAYRLMGRRGYRAGGVDQGFKERYDDAIRWATKVASGTVSPPGIIDATPGFREGAPTISTGQVGNTLPGNTTPTITIAGGKPFPGTNIMPGKRGW